MPLRKRKYRLVYIEWIDATANEGEWIPAEEAINWASKNDPLMHHIGWVIDETDKYILLTGVYAGNGNIDGCFKIPKVCIKKIIPITDTRFK